MEEMESVAALPRLLPKWAMDLGDTGLQGDAGCPACSRVAVASGSVLGAQEHRKPSRPGTANLLWT